MKKNFKPIEIEKLIEPMGGCIATDSITVDGLKVGFMDRYPTERANDSGWCFMAGNESQEYMDDTSNMDVYNVNTIANYDAAVIPYLNKPHGTSWIRVEGTDKFEQVEQPDLL